MTRKIVDIANRFIEEKDCGRDELEALKKWLSDSATHTEVEGWLSEHWANSAEIDSTILIETVFKQILIVQPSI